MEDEKSTDEDEHIRKFKIDRENLIKYKDSFLLNNDFDSGALRTSDSSIILRSVSLNTALDDTKNLTCEVCSFREKMGRNRRHPQKEIKRKFQRHEISTILFLGVIDFIGFCSMSVMAPFFPREVRFFILNFEFLKTFT